jgi:hypothetical protein
MPHGVIDLAPLLYVVRATERPLLLLVGGLLLMIPTISVIPTVTVVPAISCVDIPIILSLS